MNSPHSPQSALPAHHSTAKWWHKTDDGERIICDLCPRACQLKSGDRGFCFVRENVDGNMVLSTYGRSTGFCIDPVEKKPLNHFFPGTPVLSFGTAGCNLGCKFCQNWDISKSREIQKLSELATPSQIADAAQQLDCTSVAFTYNDPVIWAEYAIDTAIACRERGIKTIAVTAGYISPQARKEFFAPFDAANVDLKAFTEDFYYRVTLSHLAPVLDTLRFLRNETDVWFELTNLIIPGANDAEDELRRMCDWIATELGTQTPVHFSAFHPDFRMRETPATPPETLQQAYEIARQSGLAFPYVGNIHDERRQSTYCPECRKLLIQRDWYEIGHYALHGNHCPDCGTEIAGRFAEHPGEWGRKRLPVQISSLPKSNLPVVSNPEASKPTPEVSQASPLASLQLDPEGLPNFTSDEQLAILEVASHLVTHAVVDEAVHRVDDILATLPSLIADLTVSGIFVTLKRSGHLRGCCGMVGQSFRFAEALAHSAKRTAIHDHRFNPVQADELDSLSISVSILGPLRQLTGLPDQLVSQIQLGRHGLKIHHGSAAGLLLPQVAIEQGWSTEEFLRGVARKAGLHEDAWQTPDAKIEVFPGIAFEAPFAKSALPTLQEVVESEHPFPTPTLQRFVLHARRNIEALLRGATPMVYAPDLPDRDVCGLILTAESETTNHQWHWSQIALAPSIPLQSTLFSLCQAVTKAIHQGIFAANMQNAPQSFRLGLSILSEGSEAGSLAEPRLTPFNASRHGFLLLHGNQWSFGFQRDGNAGSILQNAVSSIGLLDSHAALLRFHVDTTLNKISAFRKPEVSPSENQQRFPTANLGSSNVDSSNLGSEHLDAPKRAPAVAGLFYPQSEVDRNALVASLIQSCAPLPNSLKDSEAPISCTAIMTPHAGLKYSGKIAAGVWSRVKIPSRVLIIGPKHTPDGSPWAVAPHSQWTLSDNTCIAGDLELSELIAHQVQGMRLDAAAHRREHGIEVQLPFLSYLAPETKVTAITMQGGSWDQIAVAAEQLATVLGELPELPLIAISSDMNHFANEHETRRRDALALEAFSSRDGELLLETCRMHEISMCGVIPASLVLQLLKYLKPDYEVLLLGYGTSAETSGDFNRVVGYASAILT